MMVLDRFLRDQNVVLYRRLLKSSTGISERRMIFKLLAEEMGKLKNEHKFGKPVVVQIACTPSARGRSNVLKPRKKLPKQ